MKQQYILWIISLFLFSCESEIEIKMTPTPSRIVVNASVTPGQEISAHISKSWFITDVKPDFELPEARVSVYVNKAYQGDMQPTGGDTEKKGQYVLPGSRIQTGDKIAFEVESPGYQPVASEVQVPPVPDVVSIDTINMSSADSPRIQLYIHFRDKGTERNYYRLFVEKESEFRLGDSVVTVKTPAYSMHEYISDYHILGPNYSYETDFQEFFYIDYDDPVFRPAGSNPLPEQSEAFSCWGTFSDDLINGEEYTLKSMITGEAMYSYIDSEFSHTVHYTVQLLSISESYYQYMKAVWAFQFDDWNLEGLREPLPTYTNVNNGYGVVAAYQVFSRRITMPAQTIRPTHTPFGHYLP